MALIEALESPPVQSEPAQAAAAPSKGSVSKPPAKRASADTSAAQPTAAPAANPVQAEPEADPIPSEISQKWDEIRSLVRQKNPQTQALLNSCKLLGIKGGTLILGFNGEFAKSKMEQGDNLEILKQAMQQVMGESMPVRCVLSAAKSVPADLDNDGMVATALRDLGGEIVDIQ
jgi:hypothetical protein